MPDAGPEVGEHVLAVGDQGEGAAGARPDAHQVPAQGEVGEPGAEHDQQAGVERAHLARRDRRARITS